MTTRIIFNSIKPLFPLICSVLACLAVTPAALAQSRIKFTNTGQSLAGRGVATDAALGDMDGDGDLDAIVANSGDSANKSQLWINQGGDQNGSPGTFADSGQLLATGFSQAVALADLDDDGDLDAFFVDNAPLQGAYQVWINQGGTQAGTPGVLLHNGQHIGTATARAVGLGGLDEGKSPDAFIATFGGLGYPDEVWINNGSGQFSDSGQQLGNEPGVGVLLGDLDRDGDLDAFVLNGGPNNVWLNQAGRQGGAAGTFVFDGREIGTGQSFGGALGDLDRDGDMDVVVAKLFKSELWLNQGGIQNGTMGVFAMSQNPLPGATDVALGDLDRDGDLDVVFGTSAGNNPARLVFENSGPLTETGLELGSGPINAVKLGDLDGDGDLDAFICSTSAPHEVWLNNTPPATDEPNLQSAPAPGTFMDFGTLYGMSAGRSRKIFLANTGLRDLEISAIDLRNSGPGFSFQVDRGTSFRVTPPYRLRYGNADDILSIRVTAFAAVEPDSGATLEVVSNDPDTPVVSYTLAYGADLTPQASALEEALLFLGRGLRQASVSAQRMASGFTKAQSAQTVTLHLDPDAPHSVNAAIPDFLGGGSVLLSNFTGTITVSLEPIPADSNQMVITVNSGTFTAPSVRLPNGIETGPNTLTFGPASQSDGLLNMTTGEYTASATAKIVNVLFPGGFPVRGSYSGIYNSSTDRISLRSQSTDSFRVTDQLGFIWSAGNLRLTWMRGALEKSLDPRGTWERVLNARSPFPVDTTVQKQQFFRLRLDAQ